MKARCDNPNATLYNIYGGRGITYCERWKSFENFLADMGERPPGTSIDRINNDGNYEPGNCRWADKQTQRRNNSQHVVWVEVNGKEVLLVDAVKELQTVPAQTAYQRIHRGWTPEDAVGRPYTRKFKHVKSPTIGVQYTFDGKTQNLTQWAADTGIQRVTLLKRIQAGMPLDQVFTVKGFLGYRREAAKSGELVRPPRKFNGRKSNAPFYTFDGKTLTLAQWEKETGIKRLTLRKRIASGMPIEQALTIKNIFDHRRELKAP